eukprot:146960_1
MQSDAINYSSTDHDDNFYYTDSDSNEEKTSKIVTNNIEKNDDSKVTPTTTFQSVSLRAYIIKQSAHLNEIINLFFEFPSYLAAVIYLYTLNLLPGLYSFKGKMDYGNTGYGNYCSCEILLNSNSQIIGGYFGEDITTKMLKYHITKGTYNYKHSLIEFTKHLFDYACEYKMYGKIYSNLINNEFKLTFEGKWSTTTSQSKRGGNITMQCIDNGKNNMNKVKINIGTYLFDKIVMKFRYNYIKNDSVTKFIDLCDQKYQINDIIIKLNIDIKSDNIVNGYLCFYKNHNDIIFDEKNAECLIHILPKFSEWDHYGGLKIVLENNCALNGYFNGNDYLGMLKFKEKTFGNFEFQKVVLNNENDT